MDLAEFMEKYEISEDVRKAIFSISTGVSLKVLLVNAFFVLQRFRNDDKLKDALPDLFRIIDKSEFPKLQILERIWRKLDHYFYGEDDPQERMALYEVAEDVELLSNYFPELGREAGDEKPSGDGVGCHLAEKIASACRLKESDLQDDSKLGPHHILSRHLKIGETVLDRANTILRLEDDFRQWGREVLGDEDPPILCATRALRGWYKLVMALGGTFDRHCLRCLQGESCNPHPSSLGRRLAGITEFSSIPDHSKFASLPDCFKDTFGLMCNISQTYQRFLSISKETVPAIVTEVTGFSDSVDHLEVVIRKQIVSLKASHQNAFWLWYFEEIAFGLRDLKHYAQKLVMVASDFDENMRRGDSLSVYTSGLNLIKAITVEEILDLRTKRAATLLDDLAGISGKAEMRNLSRLRSGLDRVRSGVEHHGDGGNVAVASQLEKLYKVHYKDQKFMHLSANLKTNLLFHVIRELQTRLAVLESARLIDTFNGRNGLFRVQNLFLISLPVFLAFMLCSLGYRMDIFVWICVGSLGAAGVAALVNAVGRKKYRWPESIAGKQLLPEFLVPMLLSLTPFVLSDELKVFVFQEIDRWSEMTVIVILFSLITFFAIWKLQGALVNMKWKNMVAVFGLIWPQSFLCSLFIPFLLQNAPPGFAKSFAGTTILHIPRAAIIGTFDGTDWYLFPCASIIFSVLCLFVAVFLEGLYRKK